MRVIVHASFRKQYHDCGSSNMKSITEERMFSADHAWIEMEDDFTGRCGVSNRLVEKIGRVIFVDFPDVDSQLKKRGKAAMLESDTDLYDVLSPLSGRVIGINAKLAEEPWLMNGDPYGEGWIYRIDVKEPNEFDDLMTADEYEDHMRRGGDI